MFGDSLAIAATMLLSGVTAQAEEEFGMLGGSALPLSRVTAKARKEEWHTIYAGRAVCCWVVLVSMTFCNRATFRCP